MKLIVTRFLKLPTAYASVIRLSDSSVVCYAIERLVEDKGIPVGLYGTEITYSPRFERMLPWINVPGRTGIRIHPGNKIEESIGCVLPGAYLQLYKHSVIAVDSGTQVIRIMDLMDKFDIRQIEFIDKSI